MPFVTVKPKFQVAIPAKLHRDVNLHDCDPLEAAIIGDGSLGPWTGWTETPLPTVSPTTT